VSTERDHLDAETVAAWMDGGLDAASLATAEAHASNCERCQVLLATVTKTLPDTEPIVSVVSGFSRMRWLIAPLAATAAAVTLWMVVPQQQLQPQPAEAPREQTVAPRADLPAPSAGAREGQQAAEPAPPAAVSAQPERQNLGEAARFSEPKRMAQEAAQGKLGASAANAADARDRAVADKREDTLARVAESARAPAPAAVAPASPPQPAAEAALGAETRQLRKEAGPALVFVSPNPQLRWRAMPNGIERSEDGGRTWLPVLLTPGSLITGGSSPAPLVLWLVGRSGLVWLATDGTNFTRLPFPANVDLVSVASPETRIAVITTADGRVFRTDDAGRTWRQQ